MAQADRIIATTVDDADAIADSYLANADGDAVLALRRAVADALADLCEAERRTVGRERLISRGFVRGRF